MKVLKFAWYAFWILLIIWMFASWMDIIADNCYENPVHHSWNLFLLMKGWAA